MIISIIFVGLVIDLVTKNLSTDKNYSLIPNVLSIYYTLNTGAGWSLFSDSTLFLTIFTAIILVGIIIFALLFKPTSKIYSIGIGLTIAGASGNLIDRVFLGSVRDFIRLDFIDFPIFNFADICLTFGAIFLCIYLIFIYNKKGNKIEK